MSDLPEYYFTSPDEEELRQFRLKNCGKIFRLCVDLRGGFRRIVWRCGLFRECPVCRVHRQEELKDRVLRALQEGPVSAVLLSAEEAKLFTRPFSKEDYLRLPLEDGFNVIFFRPLSKAQSLTTEDILHMDWPTYALTPRGRRISGALGRAPTNEGFPTYAVVFSKESTSEQRARIIELAFTETRNLNPTNLAELQSAVRKRAKALVRAGVMVGNGKPLVHTYRLRLKFLDLSRMEIYFDPYDLSIRSAIKLAESFASLEAKLST